LVEETGVTEETTHVPQGIDKLCFIMLYRVHLVMNEWWNNDSIKAFVRCTSISNVLVCSSRVNFYLFQSSQQQKSW
jgi:hypothetical protein